MLLWVEEVNDLTQDLRYKYDDRLNFCCGSITDVATSALHWPEQYRFITRALFQRVESVCIYFIAVKSPSRGVFIRASIAES